jgi:hypothetical protein
MDLNKRKSLSTTFVADVQGCIRALGDPWRDVQRAAKPLREVGGARVDGEVSWRVRFPTC